MGGAGGHSCGRVINPGRRRSTHARVINIRAAPLVEYDMPPTARCQSPAASGGTRLKMMPTTTTAKIGIK